MSRDPNANSEVVAGWKFKVGTKWCIFTCVDFHLKEASVKFFDSLADVNEFEREVWRQTAAFKAGADKNKENS